MCLLTTLLIQCHVASFGIVSNHSRIHWRSSSSRISCVCDRNILNKQKNDSNDNKVFLSRFAVVKINYIPKSLHEQYINGFTNPLLP